jgi:purine-nucleoside phosphorylase
MSLTRIDEAARFISGRCRQQPRVVIILGSGLGDAASAVENPVIVPYGDIPHALGAAVAGHSGRLVAGTIHGVPVVVLQGRVHFYEGHSMDDVVFLARAVARTGVKTAIVTNAAGGVNTKFEAGDLMLISDHINLMGLNPLRGPHYSEFGERFPDMTTVYPEHLRDLAKKVAKANGLKLREGVYLALSGPTYETPAEVRMLRTLGADATGMSTVPEATVFAQMGVEVLGISCITNMAAGVLPQILTHQEVMDTTARVAGEFTRLLVGVVESL